MAKEEHNAENRSAYVPTRAGRKLFFVLLDPSYFQSTVADIAAAADISERQYYQLMAKPEYRDWVTEQRRLAVFRFTDGIIQASISTALQPGREGFQDRKLLLEMGGLLAADAQSGTQVNVDVSLDGAKASVECKLARLAAGVSPAPVPGESDGPGSGDAGS